LRSIEQDRVILAIHPKALLMMIVLTGEDLAAFSDATRTEILQHLQATVGAMPSRLPTPAPQFSEQFADIHDVHLEDITFKLIGRWMEGLSAPVRAGVRIIAEQGPVIRGGALMDAGISIRHFQQATTRRTRALSGDRESYFLAWNNWNGMDDREGKYAVSPITHQSLRRYFKLD
jgi:hypothetical protein